MTNTNIKTTIIDSFIINKAKTYSDYKSRVESILEQGIKDAGQWENVCKRLGLQKSLVRNKVYNGINQLVLGSVAFAKGYEDTRWLTMNDLKAHNEQKQNKDRQWKLKAADPKKGYQKGDQKCVEIMYFMPRCISVIENGKKTIKSLTDSEYKALTDEQKKKVFPYTIRSYVFNAEQIDGIEPLVKETKKFSVKLIEHIAEKLHLGLNYESKDSPCYIPSRDTVSLPAPKLFKNQKYLYSSALHEFAHSTGHKDRLHRDMQGRFGSEAYAFEELVAESTATMLCAYLGIEKEVDKNHKAYLKSWLKVCKENKNALIDAFKLAEQACDYIIEQAELETYEEKIEVTETETVEAPQTIAKAKKADKKATKKTDVGVMTSRIENGIEIIRIDLTKADGNTGWIEMTKDFYLKLKKNQKKQLEKMWGLA